MTPRRFSAISAIRMDPRLLKVARRGLLVDGALNGSNLLLATAEVTSFREEVGGIPFTVGFKRVCTSLCHENRSL